MNEGSKDWRVKLYALGSDGTWDDRGTGRLRYESEILQVKSELNTDEMLISFTVSDEDFKRQGETILIWSDANANTFALSFQDSTGTSAIWKALCEKKGLDPSEFCDSNTDDEESLPTLTLETLEAFHSALIELPLSRKDRIATMLINGNYLRVLGDLLAEAERSGPAGKLPVFFFIFKDLVHLNHSALLEELLSDEYYLTLFSALEHDPDLNGRQFNSREFLTKTLKFKNVLDITEEDFLKKVHIAYRLQYLKDTVLARCLDEFTISHLTSLSMSIWTELIANYSNSADIRARLVLKLETGHYESFCFLNELCLTAKQVSPPTRLYFYEVICDDGILDLLAQGLERKEMTLDQHNKLRVITADIVISLLQASPHLIKRHFLSPKEKEASFPFLKHICSAMLESEDISVQQQMSELLRILLSPEEQDHLYELCDVFYDQIMQSFIEKLHVNAVNLEETRLCLCEVLNIMTQCVQTHTARMRYFLLYNDVLQRSMQLFELNDKTIMLAALKFFRAVVGHKDRILQGYLVANNFFRPIMKVFRENGEKENMLFHSVLALFEVVRTTQPEFMIECLVTKYFPTFKDSPLEKYFEGIKAVYEEHQQRSQKLAGWNARELSAKEDEDYFAEEVEEFHSIPSSQEVVKRKLSSDSDENPSKKAKLS